MKKVIEVYIPQLLLIVFSVVLGLYLNQKMLERNNKKKAEQLLSMVRSEINTNQKILEEWYPYHRKVVIKLDSVKNDPKFIKAFEQDKNALFQLLFSRPSFMGETPTDAAWEVTKLNSVVSEIDFKKMSLLTKAYHQQQMTFQPVLPKLMDFFQKPFLNSPENAEENLNALSSMLNELVAREDELLFRYRNVIESFEKEKIK